MHGVTPAAVRERKDWMGLCYGTSSVPDLSGQLTPVCESWMSGVRDSGSYSASLLKSKRLGFSGCARCRCQALGAFSR